jgi:hypothetical protein
MPTDRVLSRRQLNRALLARQWLLERRAAPAEAALEHLVGLQAQTPLSPYVGLWSRLAAFDPAEVSDLIESRRAVRTGLLRNTIHLVTVSDAAFLRATLQPLLHRTWSNSPFGRNLAGLDLDEIVEEARRLVEAQPRSVAELGAALQERWPGFDRTSLGYVPRARLMLVQVPPRGLWRRTGSARLTTYEAWTGRIVPDKSDAETLVLRYLAAFGPATVGDMRTWSWLTGLREIVEGLRRRLVTFRDERGRELFDVPDAPLPDPDTPATPRFLPDFDNVLLSHDERARIVPENVHQRVLWDWGSLLVDGFVAGTWKILKSGGSAPVVHVKTFRDLPSADASDVADEGARLLRFLEPDAAPAADPADAVRITTEPDQQEGRIR